MHLWIRRHLDDLGRGVIPKEKIIVKYFLKILLAIIVCYFLGYFIYIN